MLQGGGQSKGGLHWNVTEQVRLFPALLQFVGSVVEHLLVTVADLLHLQPVDLTPQTDELTGQTVVLDLHLPLGWEQREEGGDSG